MTVILPARLLADVPPLTPGGDEARRWAERELRDPAYAAATPTPLDRMARAVQEFFLHLFDSSPSGRLGLWLAVIVAVAVVAAIVVSVILAGRRSRTRRSRRNDRMLFGERETRSAAQLRRAAEQAAAAGDWSAAIVLRVRATALDLMVREAIDLGPGATVHAFARTAAAAFPAHRDALEDAAAAFDDVRYLQRPGTAEAYARATALDAALAAAEPADPDTAAATTIGALR